MTRIIAIDPGTRVVGYAILDHKGQQFKLISTGVIRVTKLENIHDRLLHIHHAVRDLIAQFEPECGCLEDPYVGKNVQSALRIGEGRAVALLAMAEAELPIDHYAPATIKQAVVGNGRADKSQVKSMVEHLLGCSIDSTHDATDAVAVAICHAHRRQR